MNPPGNCVCVRCTNGMHEQYAACLVIVIITHPKASNDLNPSQLIKERERIVTHLRLLSCYLVIDRVCRNCRAHNWKFFLVSGAAATTAATATTMRVSGTEVASRLMGPSRYYWRWYTAGARAPLWTKKRRGSEAEKQTRASFLVFVVFLSRTWNKQQRRFCKRRGGEHIGLYHVPHCLFENAQLLQTKRWKPKSDRNNILQALFL